MSALSRLITKCTKRQLQIATTVDEISAIVDRTVSFAERGASYISDEEIDSLLPYVPVTEPGEGAEAVEEGAGSEEGSSPEGE